MIVLLVLAGGAVMVYGTGACGWTIGKRMARRNRGPRTAEVMLVLVTLALVAMVVIALWPR